MASTPTDSTSQSLKKLGGRWVLYWACTDCSGTPPCVASTVATHSIYVALGTGVIQRGLDVQGRGRSCTNTTPLYTLGFAICGGPGTSSLRNTGTARHPVRSNIDSWARKTALQGKFTFLEAAPPQRLLTQTLSLQLHRAHDEHPGCSTHRPPPPEPGKGRLTAVKFSVQCFTMPIPECPLQGLLPAQDSEDIVTSSAGISTVERAYGILELS